MKSPFLAATIVLAALAVSSCADDLPSNSQSQDAAQDQKAPESVKDRASYGIGLSIGRNLKENGMDVSTEMIVKGLLDALRGNKQLLTDRECETAIGVFEQESLAKRQEKMNAIGEKNRMEGKAFLDENKKKQGVVTTASGLQYEVIKSAGGAKPKVTDKVRTHYHGTLIDGTVFDSSVEREEPVEFSVGGVIRGWTEALQLMGVGDKWRLYIPAELAYGPRGAGSDIGPNATLIFEVELLEIIQ